jgi:hypothetical protein
MPGLRVADILDLAASQSAEAENRLHEVFQWQFERNMTSVRLAFGTAGSLVVALIAVLFRTGSVLAWWQAGLVLVAAGVFAAMGGLLLWRTRRLHRDFLTALQLLNAARPLGPLLARYRSGR